MEQGFILFKFDLVVDQFRLIFGLQDDRMLKIFAHLPQFFELRHDLGPFLFEPLQNLIFKQFLVFPREIQIISQLFLILRNQIYDF
jgi:hypothetical protein